MQSGKEIFVALHIKLIFLPTKSFANTTMNIYTDATKNLKKREFKEFDRFLNDDGDEDE